jgi:putative aminopeptidase FrvX
VETKQSFLRKLLASPGPSSFEARPAALWREQAKVYGTTVANDAYGNSFASFNVGQKPKVMLTGHIDEIGLMLTYIDKEGFLSFRAIGGWDAEQLVGQRVRLLSYKGKELLGVIGKKAVHLMKGEEKKASQIENLWIDIGAKDENDAKAHVRVGDVAVIEQPYIELLNGRIVSKAVDDRIGAYIVLEAAKRAAEQTAKAEVIAVATVQEEIDSMLGAKTAAYTLNPDVAISVDVTDATDTPGCDKKERGHVPFGTPSLNIGSSVHQGVFNRLIDTAERHAIPYCIEAYPQRTMTDADVIATTRQGIPSAVISIPNRYMHSPNEMIELQDAEHIITLIAAFIVELDSKTRFA